MILKDHVTLEDLGLSFDVKMLPLLLSYLATSSKDGYLKLPRCKLDFTQQHLREDILGSKSAAEGEHLKRGRSRVH